jgi:predicted transcriptional regulator
MSLLREDAMSKAAIFTMKLEADLRAEFMTAAEASHRPASQVVRELMREFVQRQQNGQDHSAFLHRKIEAARGSVRAGRGRSNEVVQAEFAARRAQIVDHP